MFTSPASKLNSRSDFLLQPNEMLAIKSLLTVDVIVSMNDTAGWRFKAEAWMH